MTHPLFFMGRGDVKNRVLIGVTAITGSRDRLHILFVFYVHNAYYHKKGCAKLF